MPGKLSSVTQSRHKFWRVQELRNLELLHAQQVAQDGPRQIHDQYEITLIERGAAIIHHRGCDHPAPAGSIVVVPPGEAHRFKAHRDRTWSGRTFFTDGSALHDAATALMKSPSSAMHFPSVVIHDQPLGQALRKLHVLLEQPGCLLEQEQCAVVTGAQLVLRHSVSAILPSPSGHEQRAIQRARDYLHANYDENVSLAELAGLTGLGLFQFLRVFRRSMGVPPHEYLLQIRMNRAKKLLLQGQAPVDVALATGFFDQSHFCRHFHRLVGVTPAHYRSAHQMA